MRMWNFGYWAHHRASSDVIFPCMRIKAVGTVQCALTANRKCIGVWRGCVVVRDDDDDDGDDGDGI